MNEPRDTEQLIDEKLDRAMQFQTKKYGDTPTDDLQLVPKKYVDTLKVYAGYVNSDATLGNPFPMGWTVSKPGSGDYIVGHTLGTVNFSVIIQPKGVQLVPTITSRTSANFRVTLTTPATATFTDSDFMFLVSL